MFIFDGCKQEYNESWDNSLCVIDGDWLAFLVASVVENRFIEVFDKEDNFIKKFKTRTDYKTSKIFNDEYQIKDCRQLKTNHTKTIDYLVQSHVKKILSATDTIHVLIALSGESNFRDRLPLPVQYKGHRLDLVRPIALRETREYIKSKYACMIAQDEEADDIISKFQFKGISQPNKKIIVVTLDKDARGTPGLVYDPNKNKLINVNGFGFVTYEKGTLYGEGRKWFYHQLLHGDSADNYDPCDLLILNSKEQLKRVKITDYRSFNLLNPCQTDKECLQIVHDTYCKWYKDIDSWTTWDGTVVKGNYLDLLQVYVDTVHMRRWDNDRIDIKSVLKKFEIIG